MHQQRINRELKQVGVTAYGMKKFAIRYLPKVIGKNEHICGIIYGRYKDKRGGPPFMEGLLVATDKKIIFVDHKPGYTNIDEITYDVVSGIQRTTAIFSAVTLHTRLRDYTLRFTNPNCASIFVSYVEKRWIEKEKNQNS